MKVAPTVLPNHQPPQRISAILRRVGSQQAYQDLLHHELAIDAKTEELLDQRFVRKLGLEGRLLPFDLDCPLTELQGVGDGVYFYFYFLRYWIGVGAALCLVVIPAIILNGLGDGLGSLASINVLLATSLANTPLSAEANLSDPASSRLPLPFQTIFFLHLSFEMLFCLMVFVAHYGFKLILRNEIHACRLRTSSVKHYSLMVNLNNIRDVTEEGLRQFFGQFGEIVHVYIARDFRGSLPMLMRLGERVYKYEQVKSVVPPNPQKLNRLRTQIKEQIEKIKKQLLVENLDLQAILKFQPIYAFITFNFQQSSIAAIRTLESAYRVSIWELLCCRQTKISDKMLMNGQKVTVSLPDHPDNIYYENLEVTAGQRCWRLLAVLVCALAILSLSVFFSILISAWGTSGTITLVCARSNYTMDDVNGVQYNDTLHSQVLNCYCSQFPLTSLVTDPQLSPVCSPFYLFTLGNIGITMGSSVSVAIINGICYILISMLVKWIGPNSKADLVERKIHFAFVLQFLNTAFVSFLVYGVFQGFSIIDFANAMFKRDVIILPDRYSDFDRNWYTLVGIKVILPVLIGVGSPTLVHLLCNAVGHLWRRFRGAKAKSTAQYLKARNPPRFPIESNYTKVLVMIFTAFTFSSALPLLLYFLWGCLVVAYWADKIDLLRFSRKPPLYSEELISSVARYIPPALLLHMVFAIVFLTDQEVFPVDATFNFGLRKFQEPLTNRFVSMFLSRAYQALPLTIELLLFALAFLSEGIFWKLIESCTLKEEVRLYEGDDFSYRESFERIKLLSLPNYNIKLNLKYERFLKLFATNFDERRYSRAENDFGGAGPDDSQGPAKEDVKARRVSKDTNNLGESQADKTINNNLDEPDDGPRIIDLGELSPPHNQKAEHLEGFDF